MMPFERISEKNKTYSNVYMGLYLITKNKNTIINTSFNNSINIFEYL